MELSVFFKKYDYVYKSTDKVISVDYDVFNYRSKGYGIDFISEYLLIKKLNLKTSMFNIFELILIYAFVLIYLDKNIYYKTYKRLDSDKYLVIIDNINNSSFGVNELFTSASCFYDFLDIINYVNFSENEMFAIFNKLNVVELMLVKKYCSDNFVSCLNDFLYSKSRDTIKYINNNYQYVFMEEV